MKMYIKNSNMSTSKYYVKEVLKIINQLEAKLSNVDSDTYNDLDLHLLEDELFEAGQRIHSYLDDEI